MLERSSEGYWSRFGRQVRVGLRQVLFRLSGTVTERLTVTPD